MRTVSKPDWTPDQRHAIEGRNGTILVSAAAGSGKTAVLVERVLRRICDCENPCSIENLLIVTFTRAAAAQMKEKISAGLSRLIKENPDNKWLRLQKMKLPCSDICTIDSFCINIVRDNFFRLDISPDFSILDSGKLKMLQDKAMEIVMRESHRDYPEEFTMLNELINNGGDDRMLVNAISKLYDISMAHTFPEYWLNGLCGEYENPKPVDETVWAEIIKDNIKSVTQACLDKIDFCLGILEEEPELCGYKDNFTDDRLILESFYRKLNPVTDWDELAAAAASISFSKLNSAPKGYTSDVKDICQSIRSTYATKQKNILLPSFAPLFISKEEHLRDMETMAPAVRTLINTVIAYSRKLAELKSEENSYDFSDILHFTIDLLLENRNGEAVKTELASQLSENYDEILVDEYQDVNSAQNSIFLALSKNDTNRFMVGDVKQSIYGFRQAMPEIFLSLREPMNSYDGVNYPAKITLSNNFRSRKGITESVNFVFSNIMSKGAGDLDYDENEYLYAGASFPENDESETELYLLEKDGNADEIQARFITGYIEKAIEEGLMVTSGKEQRPARFSDFCILSEGVKKKISTYSRIFEEAGIPLIAEDETEFIGTPEISFILSLMKVTDNPLDDIPLTAVMLSPVFGFTPDDIAGMRINDRQSPIYGCVVNSAKRGNQKSDEFLEKLDYYRSVAAAIPVDEFVSRLIDETGFRAIASAMKNGKARLSNLNLLIDLASKYRNSGSGGLAGFINYLEKSSDALSAGKTGAASGTNAVVMTTIHKSKGLEYPFVFLAGCEKGENNQDLISNLIITKKSGMGLKMTEDKTVLKTIPYYAANLEKMQELHSERIRVLYVAMTRPKEKLIIISSGKDWEKTLRNIGAGIVEGKKPGSFNVLKMKTFNEYILSALLKHPDANELRILAGLPSRTVDPCDSKLKAKRIIIKDPEEEAVTSDEEDITEPDSEMLDEIKTRLAYVYPYSALNGVVAKRIASDMEKESFNSEYFASEKPGFMSEDNLTPAQRGIATHRFMQYADYEKAAVSPTDELERLVSDGMLTRQEADAVNIGAIFRFFKSELSKRILSADRIYKEYPFTVSLPLKDFCPEIPDDISENEVIVVEGVVDCAFEENGKLVIVDFKTDKANNEDELKKKYSGQLSTYGRCLSRVLGKETAETIIYSFRLGCEIHT